ncbi:hypothetical protein [Streptomyces sp. NPDC057413]|uniref:hypothetical protein n=1 Tax=Streptomyces sp. NPDC057413 TaxID=3346124 RepID=UPI0036B508CD
MFPALDQLMQLMPPPPTAPAPTPWQLAPARIGFQFPADYRAFIDAYGAGEINQHLNVLAPTCYPYQPGLPPGFPGYTAFAEQDIYAARWTRTEDWRHRPAPTSQTEGGMHR